MAVIIFKGEEIYKLKVYPGPLPNISTSLPLFESYIIKFLTEPTETLPLKFNIYALIYLQYYGFLFLK
jgi:hypothetical protein